MEEVKGMGHCYVLNDAVYNGITILQTSHNTLIQWHTFSGILSMILLPSGEICKCCVR